MAIAVTHRPPQYQATQWVGTNQEEVLTIVMLCYNGIKKRDWDQKVNENGVLILKYETAVSMRVKPDHYVVAGPVWGDTAEKVEVLSPEEFALRFVPS